MKTILIVEDELEIVDCYRDMLSGYVIKHTTDLNEFKTLIETADLVISDFNFSPVFKFDHVREIAESMSKPLILCSGSDVTYKNFVPKLESHQSLLPLISRLI